MGSYPSNCKVAGIGPSCELGERGNAFKIQCLADTKVKIIGRFYDCMASCARDFHSQHIPGTKPEDACGDVLQTRGDTSLAVNVYCKSKCFRYVGGGTELRDCHCTEVKCLSCFDEPTSRGWGGNDPTEPVDPGPPLPGVEPITPRRPGFPTLALVSSQYKIPIPVVYARAIVSGNVIWIGNKRAVEEKTKYLEGDVEVSTTKRHGLVDVAIGLTDTRVAGITRIFFDNVLVYNNTYATGSANALINTEYFNVDETDPTIPRDLVTTFTLYRGGEAQKVNPNITTEFRPAYRGLTYLMLHNLSVLRNGSRLPDIRVEIVQSAEESFYPYDEADLASPATVFSAVSDALLAADHGRHVMQVVGVGLGGTSLAGIQAVSDSNLAPLFAYNPLSDLVIATPQDLSPTATYLMDNGDVLYQSGSPSARRKTYLVSVPDPASQLVFGVDDFSSAPPSATGLRDMASATGVKAADAEVTTPTGETYRVVLVAQGQYLTFMRADATEGTLTHLHTHDLGSNVTVAAIVKYQWNNRSGSGMMAGFAVFSAQNGQTSIEVRNFPFYNATSGASFTPTVLPTANVIAGSAWGNQGNTIAKVLIDDTDIGFQVFMSVPGGYRMFKLDQFALGYLRDVAVPAVPPARYGIRSYPLGNIVWLSGNTLHSIDRRNGQYLATVIPTPIPVLTGAQYYDGRYNRLTYVASGKLVQLQLARLNPSTVPLSEVIDDIMKRAGLPSNFYSTSGLEAIPVKGYFITDSPTVRGVLELLADFYSLSILDTGGQLSIRSKALSVATVSVPLSDALVGDDNYRRTTVLFSDNDVVTSVSVRYFDEDAELNVRVQSVGKDVLEDDPTYVDKHLKISLEGPIILSSTEARLLAERTLMSVIQRGRKHELTLGPKYWRLDPNDYLIVDEAA